MSIIQRARTAGPRRPARSGPVDAALPFLALKTLPRRTPVPLAPAPISECCEEASFRVDLRSWSAAACVCEAKHADTVVAALDAYGLEVTALVSEHTAIVFGTDDAEWAAQPSDGGLGIRLDREVQVHAPCCDATPIGHLWVRTPRGAHRFSPLSVVSHVVRQSVACSIAWPGSAVR